MSLVDLQFRRAGRSSAGGYIFPLKCLQLSLSSLTWSELVKQLRNYLELEAESLDVSHFILIDREGDEASGAIRDIAKFTKFYNLRCAEDPECYFLVHTKPLEEAGHRIPQSSPQVTPASASYGVQVSRSSANNEMKSSKASLPLDSPSTYTAPPKPLQSPPVVPEEDQIVESPSRDFNSATKLTIFDYSLYYAPSDASFVHTLSIPHRAKWEVIEAAVKESLSSVVSPDFKLHRFDLVDGQGNDIVANLTTAQKLWTNMSLRYKRGANMCFVINKGMSPDVSQPILAYSKTPSFQSTVESPLRSVAGGSPIQRSPNRSIAGDSPSQSNASTADMHSLMESILDKCEVLQETIRRSVSRSRSDSFGLEFERSESGDFGGKSPSPRSSRFKKGGSPSTGNHSAARQAVLDKPLQDLIHACGNGSLPDVLALIREGVPIHACDADGFTPLHVAAMRGQLEIVHYILTFAASRENSDSSYSSGSLGANHIGEAPRCVLTPTQLCGLRDRFQMTPLHYACENGHLFVAEQLLKHGADICARNATGTTPLHIICLCGASDLLGLIPENFINCATYDGLSLLHCAADQGHIDICAYLIHVPGIIIASRDDAGMTPLHYACISGHIAIIQLLIEHGSYWNCRDDRGRTPLLLAARHGHAFLIDWLVARGANINSRDDAGAMALHHACVSGDLATVKKLMEHRMDINCRTKKGATPTEVSSASDHEELVSWLEDHGGHMRPELEGQAELRVQIESATELAARAWEAEEQVLHAEACLQCKCGSVRSSSPPSKLTGRAPQFKTTPNRTREKIPFAKAY
jgi:ankyrin repeat protein